MSRQPPLPMSYAPQNAPNLPPQSIRCPQCGTQVAATLLSCPACHRLVHADRLKDLAARARAAEQVSDLPAALALWREALELLPQQSQQFQTIVAKVELLGKQLDALPADRRVAPAKPRAEGTHKNALAKTAAGAGAVALLLWKFKFALTFVLTKGKLLLLGLTNASTLFSMFLSLGVYWTVWGWKFALGVVLSIYVHEMGHVAMLRRYGFKATAPQFIPGLGALIRLQQHPTNPHEDARIGLAGPIWGLAAAIGAAGVWLATGQPIWGAIAHVGAWINLFNLLPIWSLDGGRGWRPLSRRQQWIVVATIAAMWILPTLWNAHADGILVLLLIVAGLRALVGGADAEPKEGDAVATVQWVMLLLALSGLLLLKVNVGPL